MFKPDIVPKIQQFEKMIRQKSAQEIRDKAKDSQKLLQTIDYIDQNGVSKETTGTEARIRSTRHVSQTKK